MAAVTPDLLALRYRREPRGRLFASAQDGLYDEAALITAFYNHSEPAHILGGDKKSLLPAGEGKDQGEDPHP